VHRATAVVESKPAPKPAEKNANVQWLTTHEAAQYLGKTTKAMQMMRQPGLPAQRKHRDV
jgi:hypothetical protein